MSDDHKRREYRTLKARVYHSRIRFAIFEILGRKCVRCGFDDIRALQIDHVQGGGSKERREKSRKNLGFYKFILSEVLNGSKRYQILCANCNWIKKSENKEVRKIT